MGGRTVTTRELAGLKVVGGKKRKRIGKVHRFVFHPSERRVVGFTVKRPDAALMFHRRDLFVALGGYDIVDGLVVTHDDPAATERGAIKALGIDWDACVIWVGMPVMTASGAFLGFVDVVAFDERTGAVDSLTTENGAANDAILGKRRIPGALVRGFRRGQGIALAPMGEYDGGEMPDAEVGAILVSDEALEIEAQGGAAAAAGKATAVVVDKARKGAAAAKAKADEGVERAKPTVRKVAKKTEEAVESGAFVAGRQLGRATGMFAAFKEEFDKASRGEADEDERPDS